MRKITKTKHYSWSLGKLPKGCELCVQGRKEVIFITGVCSTKCFYCPLSDDKWNHDFIWANEWKTNKLSTLVEEARLCSAKGAGITGGDPLIRINRTVKAIKLLKKTFGKKFHIHLYTPLNLVTKKNLDSLYNAGLDEIRFHPSFLSKALWPRIALASKYKWDVGIEIPSIPCYEKWVKEMIDYFKDHISFVNINELELSDTNANTLLKQGYKAKDNVSYGVKGSQKMAKNLLEYCKKNTKLRVHYCTSTLKDKVQMAKRLKLRAKNVAKKYDHILPDGTLMKGAVYHKSYPSINLSKKTIIKYLKFKKSATRELIRLRKGLIIAYSIPSGLIEVDISRARLCTTAEIVEKLKKFLKEKGFIPAIVVEYPTFDAMIVEADIL